MKFLRIVLIMFTLLPLTACGLTGGIVSGKVLEEKTDKPIPGAIVVVRWIGRTTSGSMYVEAHNVCYHVETATTDEQGGYQTKAWSQAQHKDYTVKFHNMQVDAYKQDYGLSQAATRNDEDVYLAPFKGTSGERLAYLKRIYGATGCGAQNESEKNMLPLLKALYDEAKLHGGDKKPVPNEMSLLESLRYGMETIELGFEEAEKRHLQRP
jgi:hypothetical protein